MTASPVMKIKIILILALNCCSNCIDHNVKNNKLSKYKIKIIVRQCGFDNKAI
jgi:hypothetical protein